jgi:hypothetical protein
MKWSALWREGLSSMVQRLSPAEKPARLRSRRPWLEQLETRLSPAVQATSTLASPLPQDHKHDQVPGMERSYSMPIISVIGEQSIARSPSVASGTSVPNANLVLVATLQSGVLQECSSTSQPAGAPGEAFFAFVHPSGQQPGAEGFNREGDGGNGLPVPPAFRKLGQQPWAEGFNREGNGGTVSSLVGGNSLPVPAAFSSVRMPGGGKEGPVVNQQDELGWQSFRLGAGEALQKRLQTRQSEEGREAGQDSSTMDLDPSTGGRLLPTVTFDAPADQRPEPTLEAPLETVCDASLPDVPAEPLTSGAALESERDVFVHLDLLGIAALASTMVVGMGWGARGRLNFRQVDGFRLRRRASPPSC